MFYLLDSVMKAAGALYAPLFASHVVVVFERTFAEVDIFKNPCVQIIMLYILQLIDIDKARLDYLLSTWEERVMLPPPLLTDMRKIIGTRIVVEQPPIAPPPVSTECT
jgi:hypothetical protein